MRNAPHDFLVLACANVQRTVPLTKFYYQLCHEGIEQHNTAEGVMGGSGGRE